MHTSDRTAPSTAGDVTRISNGSCVHIPDGTAPITAGDVPMLMSSSTRTCAGADVSPNAACGACTLMSNGIRGAFLFSLQLAVHSY